MGDQSSKTDETQFVHLIEVAGLSKSKPVAFSLRPDGEDLSRLREGLGLLGLSKVLFEGELHFDDLGTLHLSGALGATATQSCVVSLDPVRTRIDVPVERRFRADLPDRADDRQMLEDEDENLDPLETHVDLGGILSESIALELPDFPRAEGASLRQNVFSAEGVTPLQDEDVKPFAALAKLMPKDDTKGEG